MCGSARYREPVIAALLLAFVAQTPVPAAEPAAWKRERGSAEVRSFLEEWRDESRSRDVPVKLYHPAGDGPFPVVIFSHGLGGTRENYAYLGEHWASHGYVSVHVQHVGSDDSVWRGNAKPMQAMQHATEDLENLLGRPKDVSFAIDELTRRNALEGWALRGKLDLGALAVAGHSFGAYTSLCSAGRDLVTPLGEKIEVSDARVKACIAMSPQGSARDAANGSWREFACPVFHMTGTKDESPIRGDAKPEERRIPFDTIDKAEQYLLIFDGGDHMTFGDRSRLFGARDPAHHPLILSSSTAFLDAYLKHDAAAFTWLRDGGFTSILGSKGTFEHKEPAPAASAK